MTEFEQNVKIILHNEIIRDQEVENYELTVFGQYYKKGNSEFLKYEEAQENGMVKTILKWTGDETALVLRSGVISMRLEHRIKETTRGSYEHQYGRLPLEAYTTAISHSVQNQVHTLQLRYDLNVQQSYVGTYKMTFTFQEV
ncbi:MAG TPA: DUF1934 family protein [Bacillus sp. (in: firmicutes)]|uniref:DUF1934 domain-containing protein n=1 Tax=Bacillus litorisediminis TaxID=2922713 RepID=UPI001FACB5E5|nr:DUF1934 family protein [Bacillus litorisediminis]HWO76993.1 DUF1934 family protein [Bacillus sp. (in: firmicutes)]